MQSPIDHCADTSYNSLGERRGKSDLARFSIDLSWARAVSDTARSRAYPSPPMSGSPPLPPSRNPDSSDRGLGSYGSSGQDIYRGSQASQAELMGRGQGPPLRAYQDPLSSAPYAPYRLEDLPPQGPYQVERSHVPLSQQQPPQQLHHQHQQLQHQHQHQHQHAYAPQQPPFSASEQPLMREASEFLSPKAQRKTKGHVASACVPCKRAHLRCDAQRPCSRCLGNGKEDACVDVQHKKRGRPRLRDEREPRYEGIGPGYPTPPDPMRRPPSLYGSSEGSMGGPQVGLQRSQSNPYRILKSQPGLGPIAPRNLEYASIADANVYPPRGPQQPDPICAYLTMEMQIVKVAHGFLETIGIPSAATRKLHEIVSAADRDTIFRLQRAFEDERRKREPNYLPPIVPRFEGDHGPERVIESVMFGADELRQVQLDRNETLTFLSSDGQQRSFRTAFGLAKKGSTYFVVMLVHMPATPQMYQPSPSAYSSHSRETQYGYASQYGYQQISSPQTYIQTSPYADPRGDVAFRTPGALGQNIHPSANIPTGFTQSMPRTDYSQGQAPYQIPRSEMPQAHTQVQSQHQRDLQLPPIRDQRGEISTIDSARMKDERSRLGIDGLIEKPDSAGRGR